MKRLWKLVVTLGVMLILAITGYGITSGQAILPGLPLPAYEKGSAFEYVVEVPKYTRTVRAIVKVNWNDPAAVERYRQANSARIQTLIARGGTDPVPVKVTFVAPVPLADVDRLVNETGLDVESYTQVGRTSTGDRWGRTVDPRYIPLTKAVESDVVRDNLRGTDHRISLPGVLVLKGKVLPTTAGLGRLAQDPRVYLADTTWVEVAERITQSGRYSGKPVDLVTLETPFWSFDW